MGFMKEVTIYERGEVRVFINQCHRKKGTKTKLYAVRRDDASGYAHILGLIKWHGSWRQYVFFPDCHTVWSSTCLQGINHFLIKINTRRRVK